VGTPAAESPAAPPIDANWPIELSGTLVAPITVDAEFAAAGTVVAGFDAATPAIKLAITGGIDQLRSDGGGGRIN
jgi:hypothetical protein